MYMLLWLLHLGCSAKASIGGMMTASRSNLNALFAPQSVAIIGASSDQRRFGGRPIQYLLDAGFEGGIYPVNPAREEIQGLKAYSSVSVIEGEVDCAILAIPAEATLETLQACMEKGVRSAVLYGAGFSEMGEQGRLLQERLVAMAGAAGMRLLGPNCMGLFNSHANFYATFASAIEEGVGKPGNIAVASQSGGYGGYLLKHLMLRGLGLSQWITTGNEADVDVGEALGWMATRPENEILLGYIEGVKSAGNLIAALETAQTLGKPVIMMKVGRTAEGSKAAASHTASLTGEDAVYDALFEKYGVYRPRTTDEMLDVVSALSLKRPLTGDRIGVISISGGVGVQIADFVSDAGMRMGQLPEDAQAALRALVPACSPHNPIDMTGLVTTNHDIMEKTLDVVLGAKAFDATLIFLGIAGSAPSMAGPLKQAISNASGRHPDQLLSVAITAPDAMVQDYEALGILTAEDPSRAVAALGALNWFQQNKPSPLQGRGKDAKRQEEGPANSGALLKSPSPNLSPKGERDQLPPSGKFNEAEAKALLAQIGIPSPREAVATSPEQAANQAAAIGFPVAVKLVSADILHKTEVGGVALSLISANQVNEAVTAMQASIATHRPDAKIDGFLVSQMITEGVETILGVHRDPAFGPVVTFGLGGVLVELLDDSVCAIVPLSISEARSMIAKIKTAPLLTGYRGGPTHDIEALAQAITNVAAFAAQHKDRLISLEINPLRVLPGRGGVMALDAVIEMDPA
jgi:acetate---CoA ligase (ADP-forming)